MSHIAENYIHPSIRQAFRINLERGESGGHEHPQAFKDELIRLIDGGMTIREAAEDMGLTRAMADAILRRRNR